MKKNLLQMLMLLVAFTVSQATWAYGREKGNNGKGKPNIENRGWHKGFDQAKWDSLKAAHAGFAHKLDSLKAAHPNFGHRMDSIKAHRPHFRHHPGFGHAKDTLKAHRPHFAPRRGFRPHPMGMRRMGMRPYFGSHRFGPRPGWMNHRPTEETASEEVQVKASEIEATAITATRQDAAAPTYDLNGRKITGQRAKGIVIRNGRKIVK